MTLRQPSMFFRAMVLGAQGVFYNLFCALVIPSNCYHTADYDPVSFLLYDQPTHLSSLRRSSGRRGGSHIVRPLILLFIAIKILTPIQHALYSRNRIWPSPRMGFHGGTYNRNRLLASRTQRQTSRCYLCGQIGYVHICLITSVLTHLLRRVNASIRKS